MKEYAEGCFRIEGMTVTDSDFAQLLEAAPHTKLKRARICVHKDDDSPIQEMFVLLMRDSPKGTYKYGQDCSMFLLRGEVDIQFVKGPLVSLRSESPFIHVPKGAYHTPYLRSDYVLMHEVHEGPFVKSEHVIPL